MRFDNYEDALRQLEKNMAQKEEEAPRKVTDIDAAKNNVQMAVDGFAERWLPMPGFGPGVEVMNQGQLRDAMGLRATIDIGDPWPKAESLLIAFGFRWHCLGGQRVMYVREKDGWIPDTGWDYAEEVDEPL